MKKLTLLITIVLTTLIFSQSQGQEQIIYDNDTNTSYQPFDANDVYSVHFSPTGPCELLSVQYYTDGGVGVYGTFVYPWETDQPGFPADYQDLLTTNSGSDPQWQSKDIPGNLTFDVNGFVVGFLGSVQINLGIDDSSADSDRNWIWNQAGWNPTTTHNFQIRATVQYGLGVTEVLVGTTKVYPNPADNYINLESEAYIKSIYLSDITGKIVRHLRFEEGEARRLDVSNLKAGVYFMKLEDDKGQLAIKKIIIK